MTKPDFSDMIAILRGVTPDSVVSICEVLVEAGIGTIEVPLNSPEAFRSIEAAARALGDRATFGAGTVLRAEDVDRVRDAGGKIIVSPNTDVSVIARTIALGLRSFPGVMTPTDGFKALAAGADALKLFPGEIIGPAGLKAMKAVFPAGTQLYAVGGVQPENVEKWRAAGASGLGIGSALFKAGDTVRDTEWRLAAFAKAQGAV
ncbi:2-dehydro-3-deoxy-6-phosphogalactonate aldolase [Thalassovita aquimarina]|uniref:2-dehydro-3-deoxy-6-phosphogalactonate aldolase n=1 Tax=Thalassovita aquimarina TaxID=2785917 RepID=A0ABS5HUQ8_9RHOB|nr:2-dehydro-3-deoxy-6-phosphogalactonate aldolase [Thalassovita aquimarina]MBR9652714.1 2-dehydro-3-deoxy-6-phosphogalactonate aldolase [Thalassovita aquimarina]